MNQKICIIISKNLAEFEYLVPIIEKNKCNVDVLLFDYNIRNLIRTKSILEKYSKRNKIKVFDIQYFLRYRSKILGYISKKINTRSISIKSLIKTFFKNLSFFIFLLILKNSINFLLKKIFNFIFMKKKLIKFNKKYDFVFLGHRDFLNNFFLNIFKKYFLNKNYKFVLVPHGAHYEKEFRKNLTISEELVLKENYLNLSANNFEKPWLNKKLKKSRCINTGYPPFKYKGNIESNLLFKSYKKRILVISRKFEFKRTMSKMDGFTTNFESFKIFIEKLKIVNFEDFDVYLKPHPTTDINLLKNYLKNNSLSKVKILFDPILFYINNFDLIYSYHSTALLSGIINNIPVIYYEDPFVKKNFIWAKQYMNFYNMAYVAVNSRTKTDKFFNTRKFRFDNNILNFNKNKISRYFKNVENQKFFKILNKKFRQL